MVVVIEFMPFKGRQWINIGTFDEPDVDLVLREHHRYQKRLYKKWYGRNFKFVKDKKIQPSEVDVNELKAEIKTFKDSEDNKVIACKCKICNIEYEDRTGSDKEFYFIGWEKYRVLYFENN